MDSDSCPYCGEVVIEAELADREISAEGKKLGHPIRVRLNPNPDPERGNVVLNGGVAAYVRGEEWKFIRSAGVPIYRRHGMSCINPLNTLEFKGINS